MEGDTYTLQLDPGTGFVLDWIVDWGDSNIENFVGGSTTATHIYPDGYANHTINVTVDVGQVCHLPR